MISYRAKISIIVPAYNAENTLERCVHSILAQTEKKLQIIIIDDGSTDHTYEIIKQLKKEDKRIEAYHIENKGSVVARKLGLKVAMGDYIGFVDADDYVEPEMFFELMQMLIKSDADFVHSGQIMEEDGKQRTICDFEEKVVVLENIENKLEFLKKYILEIDNEYMTPNIWSKLYKAEFIKKCFAELPDNQQFGEDFICLFRCILECKRVMLYKKAMYHYVVNKKSLSHVDTDENTINEIRMWYYILDVLEEFQCLSEAKESMHHFLIKRMLYIILKTRCKNKKIPQFYFKNIKQINEKKIVIFGAGDVGQDYYAQISNCTQCNIVAWVDSNWYKYNFEDVKVISAENIKELIFDVVVIAVNDEKKGEEIKKILVEGQIDEGKIIWKKPGTYF